VSKRCASTLGLEPNERIRWISAIERGLTVDADPDQLFRVLLNLARNAMQALESRAALDPNRDQVRITGARQGAVVVIEVVRHWTGYPRSRACASVRGLPGARPAPAAPAWGSRSPAELVRAHGGEIRLVEGTIGATFRVTIPDRAVRLQGAARRAGARLAHCQETHAPDLI